MGGFGTSNASNQTIPQISLGRLILDMVKFGVFDVPNLPRLIWDMVKFGVFDVPNPTMSQTYLG